MSEYKPPKASKLKGREMIDPEKVNTGQTLDMLMELFDLNQIDIARMMNSNHTNVAAARNRGANGFSQRKLLSFYLNARELYPEKWTITPGMDRALLFCFLGIDPKTV